MTVKNTGSKRDETMEDRANKYEASRYDSDFYTWTQEQAALLKTGRVASIDVTNIVEELETLGRSELSALVSAYTLIAQHLLKLMHQPEMATVSWENTIRRERRKVEDLLEDNPGLKPKRDEAFVKGYSRARRDAASETGIDITTFPKDAPFTREHVESDAWPRSFVSKRTPKQTKTKVAAKKPPQL